ncbi:hypothetical protein COOONC_20052 [Cooperia oncophora]
MFSATHRFYIAYENSLCNGYITEKFYQRISQLLIPVVMKRRIYEGTDIPPKSFIALDDFKSTKELGDYLNFLRTNDTAYLRVRSEHGTFVHRRFQAVSFCVNLVNFGDIRYFEWAKDYRLPPTYTSTALCELCTDIYHKESLIIDDIAQYYTHNQCSYNE